MEQFPFEVLNRTDLVDFLSTIGIEPKKRKARCYCYLSQLAGHPQHRPTFFVNQHLNCRRETTTKQSGSLADLAIRMYNCTIGEVMVILRSALSPVLHAGTITKAGAPSAIAIERTHPICSSYLENFLWERLIPLNVAREYCVEAWYKRGNNAYATLAFRNYSRGFELFDRNHRYRLQPCRPTHIRHGSRSLAVFRRALDLHAYVSLMSVPASRMIDLLVLNAPIAFPVVQEILDAYGEQHLFLPNDAAGIHFCKQAIRALPECQDRRGMYGDHSCLNDCICHP